MRKPDRVALDVKVCQLVNLMDRGQPLKMSKRAGDYVTVRDLVDAGRVSIFAVDAMDGFTWSDTTIPTDERAAQQLREAAGEALRYDGGRSRAAAGAGGPSWPAIERRLLELIAHDEGPHDVLRDDPKLRRELRKAA